jgi:hypothetical protein
MLALTTRNFLLCVKALRFDFLSASVRGYALGQYLLLEAVVEPGFPEIDGFIGTACHEVVSLPTELSGVGGHLYGEFESVHLCVPYFGGVVLRAADEMRGMWMEIDVPHGSLMSLIDLNDSIGP